MVRSLFLATAVAGVDGAVIETRPHQNIQSAQLQNATDAVIRTAAVAGLAYAGAYLAGAQGSHESNTVSDSARQAANFFSSTGQALCSTGETNPENFHCTASRFNGHSHSFPNVDAENQAVLPVRNYWCCPNQALGGAAYQGKLDGVCSAGVDLDMSGCVYHGPCAPTVVESGDDAPGKCTGTSDSSKDGGIIGGLQTENIYGQGAAQNYVAEARVPTSEPSQFCCINVPSTTFKNDDGVEISALDALAQWKTPTVYAANVGGEVAIGGTIPSITDYHPDGAPTEQVHSFCSATAEIGTFDFPLPEGGNYIKCYAHTA